MNLLIIQGLFSTSGASHHQVHLFVNDVACTLLVPRCSGRKTVGLFHFFCWTFLDRPVF